MSAAVAASVTPLPCELNLARLEKRLLTVQRELQEAAANFAPHQVQIAGARHLAEQAHAFFERAQFDADLNVVQLMIARRTLAETILNREEEPRAEYAEARRRLLAQEAQAQREFEDFRDNQFEERKKQELRERAAEERRLRPQHVLIDPLKPNERVNILADGTTVITQVDDRLPGTK